jgi:hypothetical protein
MEVVMAPIKDMKHSTTWQGNFDSLDCPEVKELRRIVIEYNKKIKKVGGGAIWRIRAIPRLGKDNPNQYKYSTKDCNRFRRRMEHVRIPYRGNIRAVDAQYWAVYIEVYNRLSPF